MTTKEQERKSLAQIKKIVEGLGANSYIGMAFEGCFEIAEENIENDFGCSMKQRAKAAEEMATKLELDNRDLRLAVEKAKKEASKEITALQLRIEELEKRALTLDDLTDCRQLVDNEACDTDKERKSAAMEIVTFAEDPSSTNFQNAVKEHRAAEGRWNHLLGLKGRIERAMGTTA